MTRPPHRTGTARKLAVVALAALAMNLLIAAPAHADSVPPTVEWVERLTATPKPGSPFTVAAKPADDGGSGAAYAILNFRSPTGRVASGGFSWVGDVVHTGIMLTAWAESGRWTLDLVVVADRAGNETRYYRDGRIETSPVQPASPIAALDLSVADFTIDNPNQDIAPPSIERISVLSNQVVAGTPVIVLYEASDDRSGVAGVIIGYQSPVGNSETFNELGMFGPTGPASWVVPLASPGGSYRFSGMTVIDRAGNRTGYSPDGTMRTDPESLSPPDHPAAGIGQMDFTVTPLLEDRDPPVLDSLRLETPIIRAGEQMRLAYAASDTVTRVKVFEAAYRDAEGHEILVAKHCGSVGTGPATKNVGNWWPAGVWRLESVVVYDAMHHRTYYLRNGTTYGVGGSGVHDYDFAANDLAIEAGPPRQAAPQDTSGNFECYNPPQIHLDPPALKVDPGVEVDLPGTIRANARAVADPLVAYYEFRGGRPTLLGLTSGNEAGAFRKRVRAALGAEYRVRFFGADAANPADPGTSQPVVLSSIGTWLGITLSSPTTVGQRLPIRGRLTRNDTKGPVKRVAVALESRAPGGTFNVVQRATTNDAGDYSFAENPAASREYRVRYAGAADLRGTVSRIAVAGRRPIVIIKSSATGVRAGTRVTISTVVTPAHPGSRVALVDNGRIIGWATLSRSSAAAFVIRPGRGTHVIQIAIPSHADHATASSPKLTVRVS